MPTSDSDQQLLDAIVSALEARGTSHPAVHIVAFEEVLDAVQTSIEQTGVQQITMATYEEVRTVAAEKAGRSRAHGEIDRVLFDDYRLLRREGDSVSIVDRRDTARYTGTMILAEERVRWRRMLAHQHVLAFPEVLEVLELFAPPGKPASVAQTLRDRFVYFRKFNQVTVDYSVDELDTYGLLQKRSDGSLCSAWGPPAALAGLLLKHYLLLTDFRVEVAIEWTDLVTQVSNVLPPRLFERQPVGSNWLQALNAPPDLFMSEIGGSRTRLTTEGLRWFAGQGLVAPVDCGKVLRQKKAKAALLQLRDALRDRVQKLNAANADAVASALEPA